mmetsp:Transcript_79037/g.256304  ORF Transcript_79037/g.256304 Transcript_79037/m.256304 type:complete len:241 (+) Transcript_79037:285-1007(+)
MTRRFCLVHQPTPRLAPRHVRWTPIPPSETPGSQLHSRPSLCRGFPWKMISCQSPSKCLSFRCSHSCSGTIARRQPVPSRPPLLPWLLMPRLPLVPHLAGSFRPHSRSRSPAALRMAMRHVCCVTRCSAVPTVRPCSCSATSSWQRGTRRCRSSQSCSCWRSWPRSPARAWSDWDRGFAAQRDWAASALRAWRVCIAASWGPGLCSRRRRSRCSRARSVAAPGPRARPARPGACCRRCAW